jgi:hypothetical protein
LALAAGVLAAEALPAEIVMQLAAWQAYVSLQAYLRQAQEAAGT